MTERLDIPESNPPTHGLLNVPRIDLRGLAVAWFTAREAEKFWNNYVEMFRHPAEHPAQDGEVGQVCASVYQVASAELGADRG